MTPLYPFQATALARIMRNETVYLGFDPGLGKSRTALEAAVKAGHKRILVICPASGRYVWEQEVRKWLDKPVMLVREVKHLTDRDGIFVLTYGLISQKNSMFAAAVAKGKAFDMTVLDEAAAVKNSGSNRTKAILGKMLPKLGQVLPMSGTPAPNHAGELYPILKALCPGALKGSNGAILQQWQFEDRYCVVNLKRFGGGQPIRVIEGSRNLKELRERISGFMIRVKKDEVLKDLPPIRYDVVPLGVKATPEAPTILRQMGDEELMKYLSGKIGDEPIMRLRHMLGVAKIAPAIEYIDDFLQGLPSYKKVLVFAHHREVILSLQSGLVDWHPVIITGASTPEGRTMAVDNFLKDHRTRLMIANIQAAGTGLTLVGPTCDCSDVFFVEASYSASDNVQAAARVHRIGQHEAVVARFLTAHGTIDDRIQAILARKAGDFKALFD